MKKVLSVWEEIKMTIVAGGYKVRSELKKQTNIEDMRQERTVSPDDKPKFSHFQSLIV